MKDALNKAVEGGYKNEKSQCRRCGLRRREANGLMLGCRNEKGTPHKSHLFRRPTNRPEVYLLDPLFWQALGEQQRWVSNINPPSQPKEPEWLCNWHRFIDHLAEGKDAEEFFNQLLK